MPRQDRFGNVLGGVDRMVHLNGRLLSLDVPPLAEPGVTARAWRWLRPNIVAGPVDGVPPPRSRGRRLYGHAGKTISALWSVDLKYHEQFDLADVGANVFEAGAGIWAAWNGSYFDSHNRVEPNWYPLAVDDESGLIAVITDRARGSDLALWNGTGLTMLHMGALDAPEGCFKRGVLHYRAAGQLQAWSLHNDRPPVQAPVAGVVHDRTWLIGWTEAHGLIFYARTTGLAFTVHPAGTAPAALGHDHNADVVVLESGLVKLSTSYNPGEYPEDMRSYVLDPLARTVNGDPRPVLNIQHLPGPTPPDPPDPPDPTPTPEPTPMPNLFLKTRNDLFLSCDTRDGTRHIKALPTKGGEAADGVFSIWKPMLTRGAKVGEKDNLCYFDCANFPGNTIGVPWDAVGTQAACPIRTGTAFTAMLDGDDHDWVIYTEPQFALTYREDKGGGIYLEAFDAFPRSVQSVRFVECKKDGTEGKIYTEPFQ